MKHPALFLLALVAACEAPLHSLPPQSDTAPPDDLDTEPAGETDDGSDTGEPEDNDDTDEPPEEQRFEHTCTGAATYDHRFPVKLTWGDSSTEVVRWMEGADGRMHRLDSVYTDQDGYILAPCPWMPASGDEPGYFFYPRHLLIVK